jgi:pilus assembly protein Flp/PilA
MLDIISRIKNCEAGATAVEYGLITALICIAIITAIGNVAFSTSDMWNVVSNKIVTATSEVSS